MIKPRDPMRTKTGKTRLGPLNLDQLDQLLESARKKNKPKILRRIARLESTGMLRLQDRKGDSNAG